MKTVYALALLTLAASACKPNPLSKQQTERAAIQVLNQNTKSNIATRIIQVDHQEDGTNAVVTFLEVDDATGQVRTQQLFLAYTTNAWGLDWSWYRAQSSAFWKATR